MKITSRQTVLMALSVMLLCGAAGLFWLWPTAAAVAIVLAFGGMFAAGLASRSALTGTNTTHIRPQPSIGSAALPEESRLSETVPTHELLAAMMNSMREGMLVVDGEMRVLAANTAARSLFAAPDDEGAQTARLATRRLSELTRNPAILSAFLAATEQGERVEVKIETLDADRRAFDLRVAPLQPISQRNRTERGAVGVFFDITRLERLERVRQEFLSNVSHELRTPLTAILTFVETLQDGAIEDPGHNRRFLSIIERNAARMQDLIDDILELSAIEAGKVRVQIGPVRLRPLVEDVLTALAARAAERGIALVNEVGDGVRVSADARRLEQMLTNLVDNAIKFNREDGEVRVGYEQQPERDRISVSDTGEGIAPEHANRIFERFYRVDRARSRALGGTGLGLAIVKHLARAHNGEAAAQSMVGQGSTFTIELPRRNAQGEMLGDP